VKRSGLDAVGDQQASLVCAEFITLGVNRFHEILRQVNRGHGMNGTPEISPLVSAEALAARLGDPWLLVVDVRLAADGGRNAHEAGHVPGAVFTDYAADGWRAKVGGAPGLLPPGEYLSLLLGRLGVRPDHHVVLVPAGTSANDLAASARVYWTLRTVGHDKVSILDGGFLGWSSDPTRPVEMGSREARQTGSYPVVLRDNLRASVVRTEAALANGDTIFIDARSASYFEGREKAAEALRPGRLPGAMSRDYADLFDAARHGLKPMVELERLFAAAPEKPIVSYCNTGHTAALNWFVLSELLGRKDVRLYDGSMTDWTQNPNRPVETG
jgi:thiosulfate/3-mercaptopyruvate sulfurtransferase